MGTKINFFFRKVSKPLRVIEYIVSIGVLWGAVVSVFLLSEPDQISNATAFGELIDKYEVVTLVIASMAVAAIIDLIALSQKITPRLVKTRAESTFVLSLGFFFIAALTVLTSGVGNLLWINEFTMALICAVLYLNLKVNYGNADR